MADEDGSSPGAAALDTEEAVAPGALDETEREELQNPGYEIFIAVLSILSIVNLLLIWAVSDQALDYVLLVMNALLSFILFCDFLLRLKTAPSRSRYFFRQFGWADLFASLPLMQLKVLRVFRLIRVYRLMNKYGARNVLRAVRGDLAGSALLTLLLAAILVLEFGSLWMLRLESASPDANITTASDALWYTIVTISTVGYGDQYPVTNPGRILGSLIIVVGVGIFGTLTGWLANAFLSPKKKDGGSVDGDGTPPDDEANAADPLDRRLARLERVRALLDSGALTQEEYDATKAEILAAG